MLRIPKAAALGGGAGGRAPALHEQCAPNLSARTNSRQNSHPRLHEQAPLPYAVAPYYQGRGSPQDAKRRRGSRGPRTEDPAASAASEEAEVHTQNKTHE